MDTTKLKKFAQQARRSLLDQVSSKLGLVLKAESAARRESPSAVKELENAINELGKEALIDKVAYIWFNRFCALRFMDVNGYNRVGIVSPTEGQVQPEILAEAKAGHIDDTLIERKPLERVTGLLNGSIPSQDAQAEAYRQLIVSACNKYHSLMPYLFQRIDDYTELLMPDDLLSENSILAHTRNAMTFEACESVEVIGWLYQFYISEKKDKVFEDLKKNKKVTAENIPAATQLFTPHWIVRYLVENSLGRLWILNHPNSPIAEKMDYYIKPEEAESDFLKITSPEEIKICDPAAGSGHMLTYAYDLLYAIYLDAGYDPVDIPELILTKNLHGIEIDERAAELAAFALSMKAIKGNPEDDGNNRRRFFRNPIKPNICKLEKIVFTDQELDEYFAYVGKDLFTADLRKALKDFEEADNFGSLIRPSISDVSEVLRTLEAKDISGQLLLTDTHKRVLQALKQAEYLSQKYHVVVANPPYMGGKGMNPRLSTWAKEIYPDSKSDLFAMFMERGHELIIHRGFSAMVTMQSWMFLSSYESLRGKLLTYNSIESMAHMANMVMGIAFGTTATVFKKFGKPDSQGAYCYVEYEDINEQGVPKQFPPHNDRNSKAKENGCLYRASAEDFGKIPGSPLAYWVSRRIRNIFSLPKLRDLGSAKQGLATADNGRFVRTWHEVAVHLIGFGIESEEKSIESGCKWFPYNKGGERRKWYGNQEFVLNWKNGGQEIRSFERAVVRNPEFYFRSSISWGLINSGGCSFRYYPKGFIYDVGGMSYFPNEHPFCSLAMLNTRFIQALTKALNPTVNLQIGDIASLPFAIPEGKERDVEILSKTAVEISKSDWDSMEISWCFTKSPLLSRYQINETLHDCYISLCTYWQSIISEMQRLEEENNRIFIEAYGLQDELTPEVPIEEITLTCNPAYRYGIKISEEERENRLRADTMAEFLSYAVGCMFGRYSLDEPGLILANQGERLEDYLARIPSPTFVPDADNVIPMIDFEGDWFEDDITELFKQFLRVTFGDEHFVENLNFIEDALGKDIRKYFLKDFYNDHVKRYKKRPIYWLFSSPKGTFNALIYMHRYRSDTVSIVLNEYLREFRAKLEARKSSYEQVNISASSSQKDKAQAIKMIDKINKAIDEVNDFERDVLFPLAGERIEIDLDDGVKHNYPLFGRALKKITGL